MLISHNEYFNCCNVFTFPPVIRQLIQISRHQNFIQAIQPNNFNSDQTCPFLSFLLLKFTHQQQQSTLSTPPTQPPTYLRLPLPLTNRLSPLSPLLPPSSRKLPLLPTPLEALLGTYPPSSSP